jgi:thiamine pyrophosphate-dependent acetolactate synthase large subunit-like protein
MNDSARVSSSPIRHKLPTPCGAHLFARALKRHGVEVMFGQSLPSALYLVTPELGIRQIAYRTENAGGSMADGYARATNKVSGPTNYLRVRRAGQRVLTGRGLAGLGWGLPAALGAKVAQPSRDVFCISGDGGFAHVWSELETAKRMASK